MKRLQRILAVAGLSLACAAGASAGETLTLSIGTTPMKNIFAKIIGPYEKKTGTKVRLLGDPKGNGADVVFSDVNEGRAQGGAGGVPFSEWVEFMKKKGYSKDSSDLKNRVIGRDRVQILLSRSNPVKELSEEQLKGLLSGKIRNWKEVGGKDLAVVVVINTKKQPATNSYMESKLLDGAKLGGDLKDVHDMEAFKKTISETPGAIGFGAIELVNDKLKVPVHPEIGRPLVFITKGVPSAGVEKLLDFIHEHGDEYGVAR